jgi:hypothetical protein
MGLFGPKVPTDGPGLIRITYCGFVRGPNNTQEQGWASLQMENATDKNNAINIIKTKIMDGSIKDSRGNEISKQTGYSLTNYLGYKESTNPKKKGTFYHELRLANANDRFCVEAAQNAGRRRKTRKYKKSKHGKKSRRARTHRRH